MYTNVWYVAARSSELKNKPLHVKMLGTDFVLFRDQEGKPACLRNAGPHRGASL
jgi:phenylpropionate dioxygenase-like ring-hydroxylating dioxygenase large terminal subunit